MGGKFHRVAVHRNNSLPNLQRPAYLCPVLWGGNTIVLARPIPSRELSQANIFGPIANGETSACGPNQKSGFHGAAVLCKLPGLACKSVPTLQPCRSDLTRMALGAVKFKVPRGDVFLARFKMSLPEGQVLIRYLYRAMQVP
ncbi:hypothetical protein CGRA01v4_07284 [Colletotrichum graminicola]|nr:hypothetical protein CGRA01v4_07284 [Colletotrichum graminicola]